MADQKPIVEIDRVTFGYPTNGAMRPALEEVSLSVQPNDFLGIIGPNGGGKTTLLKIMLGLLRPQRGTVRVLGRPPAQVRHRIGYVPQDDVVNRWAPASVMDVVLMGRLSGSSWGFRFGSSDTDAAMAALKRTEVSDLAARPIRSLSGGQCQRVLIARALAADAAVLLLDEPTAGVDRIMERGLIDLLHHFNETIPIVMVSHDVSFVSRHLKRVACLNRRLSCHAVGDITDEVIAEMYHGEVRIVHHEETCPLTDPGCDHGCEEESSGEGAV